MSAADQLAALAACVALLFVPGAAIAAAAILVWRRCAR